jgi:Flp pilus assembly protein TadD
MYSRFRIELIALIAIAGALSACGGLPHVPDAGTSAPPTEPRSERSGAPSAPNAPSDPVGTAPPQAASTAPGLSVPVEIPARAAADFARAVGLMRAGNASEAELEFQQLAAGYPQLAGPHVNLGILHRKAGRLDPAIGALRAAVERNPGSATAWNELGVTLRMGGQFQEAATAYERAIAIDPEFAPAHRNLGVLRDLYLGDPHGALAALERYKSLSGEDRAVTGWIAELRQRTGTASPPAGPPSPAAPVPAEEAPPEEHEGVHS